MKNEVVKKKPVLLAVVAFLLCLLLLSFFIPTQAAAGSSGKLCIKERIGGNPPCTANDVRFTALDMISGPTSCVLGTTVNVEVEATIESGPENYDIGLWINESGGSALSDPDGTCYRDYLHPVSIDNSDCNQDDLGPYYNGDDDGCGDVPAWGSDPCGSLIGPCSDIGGTCLFTFYSFTVDILCFDGDDNGLVDTGWATSWDNNADENDCKDEMDTDPGTGAKCYATDYEDLNGLEICTDNDGDGFSADGGDCGPVDCDDDPTDDPSACTDCACGETGCGRCARCIHPGAEGPCCGPTCFDDIDNDCDGLIDKFNDPDCSVPCGCPPSAEASVYSTRSAMRSGALAQVGLFLIPVAQILLLRRFLRRKR